MFEEFAIKYLKNQEHLQDQVNASELAKLAIIFMITENKLYFDDHGNNFIRNKRIKDIFGHVDCRINDQYVNYAAIGEMFYNFIKSELKDCLDKLKELNDYLGQLKGE